MHSPALSALLLCQTWIFGLKFSTSGFWQRLNCSAVFHPHNSAISEPELETKGLVLIRQGTLETHSLNNSSSSVLWSRSWKFHRKLKYLSFVFFCERKALTGVFSKELVFCSWTSSAWRQPDTPLVVPRIFPSYSSLNSCSTTFLPWLQGLELDLMIPVGFFPIPAGLCGSFLFPELDPCCSGVQEPKRKE